MDLLLVAAEKGDAEAAKNARATLDAAMNLIDGEWGGIYQYSDEPDWKSPHYEKIMWYQANGLRHYAQAYALWKEPRDLAAARDIERFLMKLQSPDGAFYTSQDADIDENFPGKSFYALSAEERAKLGREPRIDTNIYARENGWAISGLIALYNATGDRSALEAAERAAAYILANRRNRGWWLRSRRARPGRPLSRRHARHGAGGSRPLCRDRRAQMARGRRPRRQFHRRALQGPRRRLSHDRNAGGGDRRVPQGDQANR